jgi:hypothetical protein
MENNFYAELNRNTVEALRRDTAFFLKQHDSTIPVINNAFAGTLITGANYFNIQLSNDVNGTGHTQYAGMNEVLVSKREWVSTLPPENRPRGIVYREEGPSPRYSFMMPAAQLNQNMFRDNQDNGAQKANYVPFQTNNTTINDFEHFFQEHCTNAINAAFTNCVFRSNIQEHERESFKTQLINEIERNPSFIAGIADKACQEVMNHHYLPFDRRNFIEKARDETSNEFQQLNSAITNHVNDMRQNQKRSFNREFEELSRPLVINIENLYMGSAPQEEKSGVNRMITDFVREKIQQDRPAEILTDTFIGTFIEKTQKLAQVGKKVFAGVALACSILSPVLSQNFQPEDLMNITHSLAMLRGLNGNNDLKTHLDNKDTRSFNTSLDKTLRDNPQALDQAISRLQTSHERHKTQSAAIARK